MNLFVFKTTVEESVFKTVITREYISVREESIDWRFEDATGTWDNYQHTYKGWVPYIDNVKTDIYQHIQGKEKMIFSSLLADDFSYRLYPKFIPQLITKPQIINKF